MARARDVVSLRKGPRFFGPPRSLVLEIARRSPSFWPQFTRGIDAAVPFSGVLVNWYRDAAHNQRVGGELDSQHRYGTAVDIQLDDWSHKTAAIVALKQRGFFVVDEVATKNHLHVQAFPKGALQRAGIRPG